MREMQLLILIIFAGPIAIMSWILWRVTVELGFFGIAKHQQRTRDSPIEIQPGSTSRFSNVRSSRLDMYSR
jgi:hypothetical protein